MKIEKKYLPPSLIEVFGTMIFFILGINIFIFLAFGLIRDISFAEIFNKNWIPLLATPMIMGMIHALTNRNVILKVSGNENLPIIRLNIETLLKKNGYKRLFSNDYSSSFEYENIREKLLYLGKGHVSVVARENELEIRGKIRIMDKIETKLRWNNSFTSQTMTEQ